MNYYNLVYQQKMNPQIINTPNVGLNEVRIAYVLKKEDLVRSVQILKEALKVYNSK
jgi:hypothetical protein